MVKQRACVRLGLALAVVLAAVLVLAPAAFAHVPILEQPNGSDPLATGGPIYSDAQPIEPPVKSLAIYGFLAHDERYDAYRFSVPKAMKLDVELLVPVRGALKDFSPTLMVIDARTYDGQKVPPAPRDSFYEPFSVASFWRVAEGTVSLKPNRPYYFVVRSGAGAVQSGAYVIGVGGPEEFGGGDTARTVRALPVIWSGAWGGGPFRAEAAWCAGLALLGAVILGSLLVRRKRRRGGPTAASPPAGG